MPFTHTHDSPSSRLPNPRFLNLISFYFMLWISGSSSIFGLWGGSLFSCELRYVFKQMFLLLYTEFFVISYWEGFLGYLVYNIARRESLPHFLHFRGLLHITLSFLWSCLQEVLLSINTWSRFFKCYLSLHPLLFLSLAAPNSSYRLLLSSWLQYMFVIHVCIFSSQE